MILLALVFVLILTVFYLFYNKTLKPLNYWKTKGVPHQTPFLFFGNFAENVFRTKCFSEIIKNSYNNFYTERYFGIYQFLTPALVIKDPELIKQITIKDFDHFTDHRQIVAEDMDPLWSKNLFATKGKRWRDLRVALSPAFTTSKMKFMFSLMTECAEDYSKHFYQNSQEIIPVNLREICTRYTNDMIATTAFGVKCDSMKEPDNEFYAMGRDVSDSTGLKRFKFFLNALSPTLMRLLDIKMFNEEVSKFFKKVVDETLKIRRNTGLVRPDMIHLLMEAQKGRLMEDTEEDNEEIYLKDSLEADVTGGKEKREMITDEDITAQAAVFFLGGFDTTAQLMSWIGYELAYNPDIQTRLIEEIDDMAEKCQGKKVTYNDLMSLKYLDMVISETLRKWSPAFFLDRITVKPYTIEPVNDNEKTLRLEVGDILWIPVHGIHHDPKFYENPQQFDPERFSDENKQNINAYNYLPFGVGPRNCIGNRFALLENKVLFFYLLQQFKIVPIKKTDDPFKLDPSQAFDVPVGGFQVGLKRRNR